MGAAAAVRASSRRRRSGGAALVAALGLVLLALVLLAVQASAATAPAAKTAQPAKKTVVIAAAKKPVVLASAKKAPAAPKTTTPQPVGSSARAAASQARLGDEIPDDPRVVVTEADAKMAVVSWEKFAAAFPRFMAQIKPGLKRGRELAAQPVPAKPTDPIVGDCVPFKPPAPYTSMQEYAKTFRKMKWQEAERIFKNAKTYTDGIGIRGCAAGVIAGDNLWAQLGYNTPLVDSWSGKCIDEDPKTEIPYALTNAIAPFVVNKRDWRTQRVPGDKLAMAGVELGKSWLDGQPAWVFDYSKSEMLYGFDFRDIRDEVRVVEPGLAIGTVYAMGSNATHISAFNPTNNTLSLIYFFLMQVKKSIYLSI
jgi:hypothetical protein